MKTKSRTNALVDETSRGLPVKNRRPGKAKSNNNSNSSNNNPKDKDPPVNDAAVLQSTHILPYDHEKLCGRFCALACRNPEDDACTVDELDPLQLELEHMLLHNVIIQSTVANATNVLQGRKVKAEPMECDNQPSTSGCINGVSPAIKLRLVIPHIATNGCSTSPLSPSAKLAKGPGRRFLHFWPQNHMPDKFWQFVSTYCCDIQPKDVTYLKELYQDSSEEKFLDLFKSTPLGKHYSLRWSETDSGETSRRSSVQGGPNKRKIMSAENSDSEEELGSPRSTKPPPKKAAIKSSPRNNTSNNKSNVNEGSLGSLTERLVQALIQENNTQESEAKDNNNADKVNDINAKDLCDANGMCSPNRALIKSLNLGNVAALERRIRKELKEQGLLDDEEDSEQSNEDEQANGQEDEVSGELQQRQEELRHLMTSNRTKLIDLEKKALHKIKQQDIQKHIHKADQEIDQLCSKFYCLVPKRKPCNKKEKDTLNKSLKDRHKMTQQLDAIVEENNESKTT